VLPIIAVGGLIELGCALVNLAGVGFGNFLIANMLVGIGWNFAFVGGSSLLTTTYTPSERAKVQASHDFTVYSATQRRRPFPASWRPRPVGRSSTWRRFP
jgi:hypothetical protein